MRIFFLSSLDGSREKDPTNILQEEEEEPKKH
jgi:hypothetical protein